MDGAKFCPLCGAPQGSGQAEPIPESDSDTVYFGGGSAQPSGEEDTVFMGEIPSSEEDTVFMGSAPQNIGVAPQAPSPVKQSQSKPRRNTSYESSNIGMSTPKKIIIIAGLVIIAALAVYLVFDFMSA